VTLLALTVPPAGLETDSYADLANNNLRIDASDASPRWTTRVLLSIRSLTSQWQCRKQGNALTGSFHSGVAPPLGGLSSLAMRWVCC
jgi:hypothetical protein